MPGYWSTNRHAAHGMISAADQASLSIYRRRIEENGEMVEKSRILLRSAHEALRRLNRLQAWRIVD